MILYPARPRDFRFAQPRKINLSYIQHLPSILYIVYYQRKNISTRAIISLVGVEYIFNNFLLKRKCRL